MRVFLFVLSFITALNSALALEIAISEDISAQISDSEIENEVNKVYQEIMHEKIETTNKKTEYIQLEDSDLMDKKSDGFNFYKNDEIIIFRFN